MPSRTVVLINSNRMKPPVAPLALDYIGGALKAAGYVVRLVDLSLCEDDSYIEKVVGEAEPIAVGVTFRNSDDCLWPSCAWFVPQLRSLVDRIKTATSAPVVLGGCGVSIFPIGVMEQCGADLAIAGDGEEAFVRLVGHLDAGTEYRGLPGLAHRNFGGRVILNPPRYASALDLTTSRDTVDNPRYLSLGGMGNIETKRGCPSRCVYCADPLSKGNASRLRAPGQVADEVESLLRQGVDVLHICDSEFNIPADHALAVCKEIGARGLGERLRWYCYASAEPFSAELARAMRRAGCVGINFGVDHACDRMLATLGRPYRREAIRHAVEGCRRAGITVMLDLLFGGPGEDKASIVETVDYVKSVNPDQAGAAVGVRIYPRTQLADNVRSQGPLTANPNIRGCVEDNDSFFRPIFYIEQGLGEDPSGLVADIIGDDRRFFLPARIKDIAGYNYNDNTVLTDAIAAGHRGAFWDILRRLNRGL